MYPIGAKVVHPCYGAGSITRIQHKTIGETTNSYYVIRTVVRSMEVMVPVDRASEVGVRDIGDAEVLRSSLEICSELPEAQSIVSDLRSRQTEMRDLLKSGAYREIAHVTRTLYFLNNRRPLGTVDRQLFEQGKEMLAGELALALGVDLNAAMQEVEDGLARMM